jgi:hypothetical protein
MGYTVPPNGTLILKVYLSSVELESGRYKLVKEAWNNKSTFIFEAEFELKKIFNYEINL